MIIVNILGYDYPLKGDFNPEHIRKIALKLDLKMREIQNSLQTKSIEKTAVITALNIENELTTAQESRESIVNELEKRTNDLINTMEAALQNTFKQSDNL